METRDINRIVTYWMETAARDMETIQVLFRGKRYAETLFFGHLVLEKILKAHVVQTTQEQAPYLHDLVRLAGLARLDLPPESLDLLDTVNDFNIRARYPEIKHAFFRRCTKPYTEQHLKKIATLYTDLCLALKPKK